MEYKKLAKSLLNEGAYSDKKLRGHAQSIAKHLFEYIRSVEYPDDYDFDLDNASSAAFLTTNGTLEMWYRGDNYYDFPYVINDVDVKETPIKVPSIDFRFVESHLRSYESGAFIHDPEVDESGYISMRATMTYPIKDEIKKLANKYGLKGKGDFSDKDFKKDLSRLLNSSIPEVVGPKDEVLIHELTHAIDKARHGGRHGLQKKHPDQNVDQSEINAYLQGFISSFEKYVDKKGGLDELSDSIRTDFRVFLKKLKHLNKISFGKRYLDQPKETKQRMTNRFYRYWDEYVRI